MTEPPPAPAHDELLRADRVGKVYADGDVNALVDVNLTIGRGEYVAIMGPSGSGKSTLLNILGLLDDPSSGEVYFEGRAVSHQGGVDRIRSQKIGFIFQSFHLLPMLTALENVQVPMFEGPLSPAGRVEKATRILAQVGMSHRAGHLPLRLSVGERQRVAIARALANDPVLLLADEPTGNLDTRTGQEILALFALLRRESQLTLLVVTHDRDVAQQADRVIHVRDGRIESDQRRSGGTDRLGGTP